MSITTRIRKVILWANIPSQVFLTIALEIAIFLFIISLDPFKIDTNSNKISREAFWRLASPFYPTIARNEILVVTISDDDLPFWKLEPTSAKSWPISFQDQRDLLELILTQKPQSVFLDFYFDNYHNDDNTLPAFTSLLSDIANQTEANVFIADLPNTVTISRGLTSKRTGIVDEIKASGIPRLMAGWEDKSYNYPMFVDNKDGELKSSVAFGLYQHYIRNNKKPPQRGTDYIAPMSVLWGLKPSRPSQTTAKDICFNSALKNVGKIESMVKIFRLDLLGSIDQLKEGALQPCLFHNQISASDLISYANQYPERLQKLIHNKVVLVGANIEGIYDTVVSPIHGSVPGIFLHAMALDNLLTFEDRYFTEPSHHLFGALDITSLIEIIFIILIVGSFLLLKRGAALMAIPFGIQIKYQLKLSFFWLVCVLITLFILTYFFAIVPINWLGLISILIIVTIPSPEGIIAFGRSLFSSK